MNTSQDIGARVRSWLHERLTERPDPYPILEEVLSRLPTTPQRRRWWPFPMSTRSTETMSSTARLVVVGVIVALFGGFLLVGVLTTQPEGEVPPAAVTDSPSPTTTEELLSGMVTEEVEPGVFRVINDGHRDIARIGGLPYWGDAIAVDATGGVWRIVVDDRTFYLRLGAEEEWPMDGQPPLVFADGRLVPAESLLSDPSDPEPVTLEGLGLSIPTAEVQEDGTVWFLGDGGKLVRVPPGGVPETIDWTQAYDRAVDGRNLVVTADEVWLAGRGWADYDPIRAFLRFDGAEWEVVLGPDGVTRVGDGTTWGMVFDVGLDGTLWTLGDTDAPHHSLARYDGSGWTVFGETDGVRPWGGQPVGVWGSPFDVVRVGPSGDVWVNGYGPKRCGGLGRFDGASWAAYLSRTCIFDIDFAPDGAVWVVASEPQLSEGMGVGNVDVQTYVITAQAVAATG